MVAFNLLIRLYAWSHTSDAAPWAQAQAQTDLSRALGFFQGSHDYVRGWVETRVRVLMGGPYVNELFQDGYVIRVTSRDIDMNINLDIVTYFNINKYLRLLLDLESSPAGSPREADIYYAIHEMVQRGLGEVYVTERPGVVDKGHLFLMRDEHDRVSYVFSTKRFDSTNPERPKIFLTGFDAVPLILMPGVSGFTSVKDLQTRLRGLWKTTGKAPNVITELTLFRGLAIPTTLKGGAGGGAAGGPAGGAWGGPAGGSGGGVGDTVPEEAAPEPEEEVPEEDVLDQAPKATPGIKEVPRKTDPDY